MLRLELIGDALGRLYFGRLYALFSSSLLSSLPVCRLFPNEFFYDPTSGVIGWNMMVILYILFVILRILSTLGASFLTYPQVVHSVVSADEESKK